MMLGTNPTVHVPPWSLIDDPTEEMYSPFSLSCSNANDLNNNNNNNNNNTYYLQEALSALQRYLPSNSESELDSDSEFSGGLEVDAYSCDQFRMFEFKVRKCARGRSHDWTECPYAHPGEKARRRDPRKYHYSGTACPDFRKGNCRKGDSCELAHGVFECWLHPARYRTQPCKDGPTCRRRVCFFAHSPSQLRVLPDSYDASPASPRAGSPPISPMAHSLSRSLGSNSINEMVSSLRNLQLGKVKSLPSSWNMQVVGCSSVFGSPRGSVLRPGFSSLPTTPTRAPTLPGIGYLDFWDEEPAMERVESGRDLRAKMFEKLSKENSLDRVDPGPAGSGPDVGWVSELVK